MRLRKVKVKTILVMLSLLVFAACGNKNNVNPSVLGNTAYGSSCSETATGDNVYTGEIVDNFSGSSGKVVLTVNPMGGSIYGQFVGTAFLKVNGYTFCCQASNGVLGAGKGAGEKHTLASVPFTCQSMSTGGTYGYYYQSVRLTVGVPCPNWIDAALTTDQRVKGCIELSTGSSMFGSDDPTYFVH